MGLENIILRQPLVRIGDLQFDATLSERHGMRNTVTRFPVESGASVSDHVANEPRLLDLKGMVSNAPVRVLSGLRDLVAGTEADFCRVAFAYLEKLYVEKTLVDVVGKYKTYKQMAVLSFDIPREAGQGDSILVQASFQEFKTVEVRALGFRLSRTAKENAQPKRATGPQSTAAASANAEAKGKTVAAALFDLAF